MTKGLITVSDVPSNKLVAWPHLSIFVLSFFFICLSLHFVVLYCVYSCVHVVFVFHALVSQKPNDTKNHILEQQVSGSLLLLLRRLGRKVSHQKERKYRKQLYTLYYIYIYICYTLKPVAALKKSTFV